MPPSSVVEGFDLHALAAQDSVGDEFEGPQVDFRPALIEQLGESGVEGGVFGGRAGCDLRPIHLQLSAVRPSTVVMSIVQVCGPV